MSDLDLETCSWCAEAVPDSKLKDTDQGRLCPPCYEELKAEALDESYHYSTVGAGPHPGAIADCTICKRRAKYKAAHHAR